MQYVPEVLIWITIAFSPRLDSTNKKIISKYKNIKPWRLISSHLNQKGLKYFILCTVNIENSISTFRMKLEQEFTLPQYAVLHFESSKLVLSLNVKIIGLHYNIFSVLRYSVLTKIY